MTLAGLARAREEGTKLGRKPLEHADAAKVAAIRAMRNKGTGIRRIARDLRVGVGTVLRVTGRLLWHLCGESLTTQRIPSGKLNAVCTWH